MYRDDVVEMICGEDARMMIDSGGGHEGVFVVGE